MTSETDIVFVAPNSKLEVYQGVSKTAATEPQYITASVATYLRRKGFSVAVIDAGAQMQSLAKTVEDVDYLKPLLTVVMAYGNQPSASTQTMPSVIKTTEAIKDSSSGWIAIAGPHPSALPKETLLEIDNPRVFVIDGEEQISLERLLTELKLRKKEPDFTKVPGLWWREKGIVNNNIRAELVNNLDTYLPTPDYDLWPVNLGQAHDWHTGYANLSERTPYAAIWTSLGCPFRCHFCMINSPFFQSEEKRFIRTKTPNAVVSELRGLAMRGVKHVKIGDEMFVFQEKHYLEIARLLAQEDLRLNIWAYARIDTVKPRTLDLLKRAGFNWLGIGIESADPRVRDGAEKKLKSESIISIVKTVENAGIEVGANYIFGLPYDTQESMRDTLKLAKDLNTSYANLYSAMAYPGSPMYLDAIREGRKLPDAWIGYSQHSYETFPYGTETLSPSQVLRFRDNAWREYYLREDYLSMIRQKFGNSAVDNIVNTGKVSLRRKILE